jgi:succinate dehydrogenase / fumarate reductase cytochrome b subunit
VERLATRAPETSERRGLTDPVAAGIGRRTSFMSSTIGTKILIGLTGLLLVLYLILHLAGNLLIFLGPRIFNTYSDALLSNPLIYPVEIGLGLVFAIHVYKAVVNWLKNRAARPVGYYQAERRLWGRGWAGGNSRKTLASSTMIFTGAFTLFFLIVHLRQFKFGAEYLVETTTGLHMRDLYRLEMEQFANPLTVLLYVVGMVLIGFHLWHGSSSAFNSLGVDHPRYTPFILTAARVLAVVIAGGFIAITLWVFLVGGSR